MKNKLTSIGLLRALALVLPAFGAHAAVVLTTLHSFTGTNDGLDPTAGLVQGGDGYFYGTTAGGGASGGGTVFQATPAGGLLTSVSFNGTGNKPVLPFAALAQGSDGNFYGTTEYGGTNGYNGNNSTVFKISTNGVLTFLYSFGTVTDTNGLPLDGANPVAGLHASPGPRQRSRPHGLRTGPPRSPSSPP